MSEKPPEPEKTPEAEVLELAQTTDPESADGIIFRAIADGIVAGSIARMEENTED